MSVVETISISGTITEDGLFQLKGTNHTGQAVDPEVLASLLFAWDEASFYGTFVEKTEETILLAPTEALAFFTNPQWLHYVSFHLSEQMVGFQESAQLIQNALSAGNFIPSMEDWKHGEIGWKLSCNHPETVPDYANRWLSHIINGLLTNQASVMTAWHQLQSHFPALFIMGNELSVHVRETEWLQTIGWLPDDTPFRTCIQLIEAEDQLGMWRLQILLQDRENLELLVPLSHEQINEEDLPTSWKEYRNRLVRDIQKCKEIVPWLTGDEHSASLLSQLTTDQAWRFLTEGSLELIQAGIHVFLPAWWEQVRRAKPKLKAKVLSSVGSHNQTFVGISQLMDFEWKLSLGSLELSEEEFYLLLEQKERLMKIRDQWVQLTPELISQLQKTMKKTKGKHALSLQNIMKMHFMGETDQKEEAQEEPDLSHSLQVEVELNQHLLHFIHQLQQLTQIPIQEQPTTFHGTLRNYQLEGSSWLLFLRQFGLGACLADDMGLGKTVQFINYLLQLKEQHTDRSPSLLICPTSVIGNWQKELERFAPSLQVYIHYGSGRKKGKEFVTAIQGADIVITSYSLSHLDESDLTEVIWNTICLDEAQHIKNAFTKQASAIRELQAEHRIALTGTPIENRLTELWSIFDYLNPGYLGSLREFSQRFVIPIERDNDQQLVKQVQRLIQPFLLRRVKTDPHIQLDLPDKNEGKEYVPLTAEQATLYENTLQGMFGRLDELSTMERRGLILTTLTRLKQLCDHPRLILQEGTGIDDKARSHKIERLLELVQEIRSKGERCLIFTQYIEMGNLMQRILLAEGHGPVIFMNGSTPKEKRDQMISSFQDTSLPDDERPGIFILSLRAGGTGLNLTEANHVFHIDRWWNPAVENQATDRAYRIGQQRNVQVYKFITLGTIEERIDEMMEKKLSLSQTIVGSGENWITELSTNELRELFTLRHEWVDEKDRWIP
ncbi:DEAD/DEAH box helicase [Brevibacillus sp. SYSU BS000544]|uniref:DEAD/DEAH box helicase n=1 Tax=Brevibacillus sp. SYSU BS000544 TaxID=3416443 RepID=UPI003CE59932